MKPELEHAMMEHGMTPDLSDSLRIRFYYKEWSTSPVVGSKPVLLKLWLFPEFYEDSLANADKSPLVRIPLRRGSFHGSFNYTDVERGIGAPNPDEPFDAIKALEEIDTMFNALQAIGREFNVAGHWIIGNGWHFRIFPKAGYASHEVYLLHGNVCGVYDTVRGEGKIHFFSAPERRRLTKLMKLLDKGFRYLYTVFS